MDLGKAILTSTHNLCFGQKYEKYQNFYLKIFLFLVVNFFIYLNRRVVVMISTKSFFLILPQIRTNDTVAAMCISPCWWRGLLSRFNVDSKYSKTSMTQTPVARLPWLIQTCFDSLGNSLGSLRKYIFMDIYGYLTDIFLLYHEMYVVCTH